MKEYLKMIFVNLVFLLPCVAVIYFNNYFFFAKAFFVIILLLALAGAVVILNNDSSFNAYLKSYKRRNCVHIITSIMFDIVHLSFYAYLDFKFIFVLYIIEEILPL